MNIKNTYLAAGMMLMPMMLLNVLLILFLRLELHATAFIFLRH